MIKYNMDALEYISKLSEGGMREAISLMDKALAYSTDLTLENVVKALGTIDYDTMFLLANAIFDNKNDAIICTVEQLYNDGKDIKQFVKQFVQFLLDIQKYDIMGDKAWEYMNIPRLTTYEAELEKWTDYEYGVALDILDIFVKLNSNIKYSSTPKYDIEAEILLYTRRNNNE